MLRSTSSTPTCFLVILTVLVRYCEAITAIIKANPRGSPFFTSAFLEFHQELVNRLAGNADKNTSWISRTIKKPSMDSLGSWSLNKLTKFIEGDEPSPIPEEAPSMDKPVVGPFSHYSEISSATTSRLPSPSGSVKGVSLAEGGPQAVPPPRRTGSATGSRAPPPSSAPDRSVSAMGHTRPQRSPTERHWSAGPGTMQFHQSSSSFGSNGSTDGASIFTPPPAATSNYSNGWWGASNNGITENSAEGDSNPTPTASSFQPTDAADNGGFVSLMDSYSPAPTPVPAEPKSSRNFVEEADDDDLGLGNGSRKQSKQSATTVPSVSNGTNPTQAEKPAGKDDKDDTETDQGKFY